ncbi:MAG: TonB-dependent receptor [Pseudomonadota bacterium]
MRENATKNCALIPLLLIPLLAHSHEEQEIAEIVVEGRWDPLVGMAISASQGVVGQEDLDLRPRLRTGDILEVVPGLVMTQHSGTGKSNQMFLRGFNLDHGTDFATSIDGMPINIPTHGHGQGYTDLNFIIPELVSKIEFTKGPYDTRVGDFSSAGAAFLTTEDRLETPLVKLGLGENGFGRALAAGSFGVGNGDLLFGLQQHVYDGPWTIDENLDATTAMIRYSESGADSEWNVALMAYDADWQSADQVPLRAVQDGSVSRLGTVDDTVGGATSRYSLSGKWHGDFGEDDLTVRGYAIDYELQLYSNFTYFLDNPVAGDQFLQVDDRQTYGGDIAWERDLGASLRQTVGASIRIDDIGDVGLFRTSGRVPLDVVRQDVVDQRSLGLYYNVETQWDSDWRITAGLRADAYDFDVTESNIAQNEGSADDWILTPKLSVIRTLSDNAEAYFSAGRGFHSNDARGTVTRIDPASGENAVPVDPLVASVGGEFGYRYSIANRVSVSAALWYLELDSELLFVGDAGTTEASRASRRYGLELPVYVRLNDQWMVDAEIALSESSFDDDSPDGNEIPGSLDRVLSAGITGEFENGMFASLRVRHFGERPLIEDNSVRSDPSTVWNLGLGYRGSAFEFRVEALNLFDSEDDDITYFYASRLPGEPVGGVEDIHFHPIEPRTVRFFVTWRPGGDG